MTQPAYVIGQMSVKDYQDYMEKYGAPAFAQFEEAGAEVLVATPEAQVLEGNWAGNWTVILKFPSSESASEWYHSSAYAPLKQERIEILTNGGSMVIAPGFDPDLLA